MKVSSFVWTVIALFLFSYHPPTFAESSVTFQTKERVHSKILPNRLTGFSVSPDGLRVAYVVGAGKYSEDYGNGYGDKAWENNKLVIDGKRGRLDPNIDFVTFSQNSQDIAYLSLSQLVVNDKVVGECLQGSTIKFADDNQSHYCVSGDQQVRLSSYSPDNKRFAIRKSIWNENRTKRLAYIVVDGKEGKKYNQIDGYYFSPDSNNIAYVAVINSDRIVSGYLHQEFRVVLNDKEDKPYRSVRDITFSPDSAKLAYVALNSIEGNANSFVILNGVAGKAYDDIQDLVFSSDSKTLAYVASKNKKMFVVVNGKEGKPYEYVLAKNTSEPNYSELLETGSLRFDSNQKLRYLAVRNKQIVLVETNFQ